MPLPGWNNATLKAPDADFFQIRQIPSNADIVEEPTCGDLVGREFKEECRGKKRNESKVDF